MKCNDGAFTEHRTEIQFIVSAGCYCTLHVGPYLFLNEVLRCENGTLSNKTYNMYLWFLLFKRSISFIDIRKSLDV